MRILACYNNTYLALIKRTPHGDVVHVRVRHGCHLGLLYGRDPVFGMQYEDGHILFPPQAIDRSAVLEQKIRI